jgi:signal transduction histidine kinase
LIRQVFSNLLKNAIEAMGDRGTLTLVLSQEATNDFVSVLIEDTGPGLPAPVEQLFEPTFTTKESGTGLGLAISRKIVEDHGGRLTARDAPGGGAVFQVDLPAGQPTDEDEKA